MNHWILYAEAVIVISLFTICSHLRVNDAAFRLEMAELLVLLLLTARNGLVILGHTLGASCLSYVGICCVLSRSLVPPLFLLEEAYLSATSATLLGYASLSFGFHVVGSRLSGSRTKFARDYQALIGVYQSTRSQWKLVILSTVVLLIRMPFSISMPHWLSESISGIASQSCERVIQNALLMFGCGVVDAVLDFYCVYLYGLLQARIVRGIRLRLLESMTRMPLDAFEKKPAGAYVSHLSGDVGELASQMSWGSRSVIEAMSRVLGIACYIFWNEYRVGLVLLLNVPLNTIAGRFFSRRISKKQKASQEAMTRASAISTETLTSLTVVKSLSLENKQLELYEKEINEYYKNNTRSMYYSGLYYMLVSTFSSNTVMVCMLTIYGMFLHMHGVISIQQFVALCLYRDQLQGYTHQLASSYVGLIKATVLAKPLFDILQSPNEEQLDSLSDTAPCVVPKSDRITISIENVKHVYPSRGTTLSLDGVSFKCMPGEITALLGASGSGKSTVFALLLRMYPVQSGAVSLNDVDVRRIPLKALRGDLISIVTQDPVLFRGSIRSNIMYGLRSAHPVANDSSVEERIAEAMRTACCSEFVASLPGGLDYQVTDRGQSLSGGQRQRIALARAFIGRSPMILLDEATSALDSQCEIQIMENLRTTVASEHLTAIVISHRINTALAYSNHVVAMSSGRVVLAGSTSSASLDSILRCI